MPKQDTTPQNLILISLLLILFGSFYILYAPVELLLNKLFTPCDNGFSYNVNLKRCDCIDPFFGDRCENSKCVNGVPVRGQYGWSCECNNFWFGTFCDICGTHDGINGTCFGGLPYPDNSLCRTDEYDFGEVEFLGARCDLGCLKVENTRILSGNALEVYDMLSDKAGVDNILACPEGSCYGCDPDTREALCVSGFLKSLNSKICNLQCGPCTSQYCKPCSRRGECILRGSSPICVCDPRSRGTGCESLCPGVTEVFNGIASTLTGTECFGNGVCNDFAGCECYEDVEGTPRFIDNCKYECPVTNGIVCNGHGTCDLNNDGAFCACSPGWFGPSCTCSDGLVDPKTCANGDCNNEGTCTCYDDDVQGHWVGQFCTQCANNYFTEITSCLQFCNPVTSCSNHASSCVVAETILESNGLVKPCTITTNDDGTLSYDGTCAICSCDANFDDTIALTPLFPEFNDGKSLAYSCMDCTSAYYPKADTQSFDAEICNTACTFETCNNRGVCMRDTGECSCYGSCPADATTYDGECLDVSIGMSPHISSSDNCGSCDLNWGPNLDIWEGSCIFYCNPLATAEDSLPTDCYVNSVIRDECVFCSGRASNCSSLTGKPECNCEGDYTGTYCQNACGSCNNGVCEENRLYNWFLLDTPAYAKTSDNSFKCTCDAVDTEDRLTFEKEMYTLVTHDLSMERVFIDLPEAKEYYGQTCQGACKVGSDGSVCNNYGNCKSTPITGLAGSATCMTDTDCNVDPSNPAIEDTSYYCHLETTPTYWQAIEEKQVFDFCSADEVDFVKGYIQRTDWQDYCYEHVRVAMPNELLNVECSTCGQIVNDRSLWTNVEASCSAYLTHANQETLQENVKGDCSYAVANFDWESWCEFPSSDFASTCPADCVSNFRSVDWVGDTGFCATLETFTSNTFLSTHACDTYKDNSIDYCRFVPEHENSYDSNTACFVDRESILDPISNRRLSNPYSGSTNQVNCKSITQNQPEVCGSIRKDINPIKASCDSSVLNVLGTGLNECELRDQEHDYCSILNNRLDWTNCSLARPKCFYCGDAAHNIYNSHISFDTVNVDAATYNPNPESCCRPGDIVTKSGNTYKCHAANSYEDTCRYDACTSSVQAIDWTNKLSTLDELKRLDSIDIPALQSDSIRRSMNLSSYCSTRRTLDESVTAEFSLESFDSYCNFVNSVAVTSAYTFTNNHALTEEQQLELNIIKNNWWLLNNGNIIIDSYDMEYYYVSGTNRLVTTNDILTVTDSLTYKIFNAWLYLEETNNDYIFSISISDSTAAFLQLDLRNKVLYVNNVATTLYGSTTGWHRLELNIMSNTTDIVWQHELNTEKILLNQALACFGCNTIIKEVVLESPGASNVIYHDIRLVQENEDISLTYLEHSLTNDGVSSTLGETDCTAFKATPDLKALLCPNDDCLPELAKVNFGSICTNYFSVVELTEEEKVAICASDSACFTRLSTWDYAAYYDSYTYNDRPAQTRVDACSASECNNLLESFDYVEVCSSHLREVFETCTDYSTELEEWRSSFDKEGYCTAVEAAKADVKTLFTNELHNCSSNCLSRLDTINYYEFCNERAVYHGPFAPYGMTFNVSDNCRTELFALDVTHDLNEDCTSIGKTGSVTGTGQCHKVSCDCTDPTIGGERCNIQCTAGSDGSACNEESNLGTCCLSTGSEVTLANCQKDVFQSDVTIHTGQCLCYSDEIGGSNCDTFCDKCSVSNGNCISSGYCMCSAAPYEETVKSNYYETEMQQVSELQLPFNWANKQSVGFPNGLSNEQEPLYLLYTNEASCSITEVDKCCTWDDFVTDTGNPLHENYDRNQMVLSTSSGDDYVCTSDIATCAKTAISLGKTHINMEGAIYEIQNAHTLWPLPHEIRLSESALAQEPTNLYNPSTLSQTTFLNSKCPSYVLVDGYYRVEVQKENWVSSNSSCYDASISIASDKGKDVWQVHQLCQQDPIGDDTCKGYWKDADGDFVRYTGTPNTTCSTIAFQRPAFTPVPVATSLDVFFRDQWCMVKGVDGAGVGQSIERASGFISSIDCTRVKDEIVSSDFNTCKFPFFTYDKDELDNYRISKINSCTDVDMFDPNTGQKLLDFASLKSEITTATGIANPTYCVSESYFQNTTRFVQNGDQGYCRLNNASYGKCTSSFVDTANCECGATTCSMEEYCHVKDYGTTVLHECHSCADTLSPTPEKCCQKDEYYVNGVCKATCDEHWACKYNQMAQLGSTDHYMMNGIQFLKGTGPKPELFCTDNCWNPFTNTCEACDTCIANAPHQNPIDILRESKIGGYHYIKDDGTFSFDDLDNEITFVRLCQDTSNTIDNSEYALSVASKVVHEKIDFIRTDKSAQANPSSACGESCGRQCPATVDGVPCSGNGVCNKDCSCSCFTLDSNEKYILTNVEGVGFTEIPDFTVGSAMVFKSPYRGNDCSKTCPGWEDGMVPADGELSAADKQFIMGELICSGHGTCLVNNEGEPQCQCETGYINGVNSNCEFKCPGNGCSGHGECAVSLQGTSEIFIENLFLENEFNGEVSNTIMQKAYELYPTKSTYDSLKSTYYALPEAVEDTTELEFASVKYLSKCPSSHPYPYHNGKFCCVFETVANGTSINKRSGIAECTSNNRIACPMNAYFVNKDSTIEDTLRARLGLDYVGTQFIDPTKPMTTSSVCSSSLRTVEEDALCTEEARVIALNTFSDNPAHYTCDPKIALISMRRNQRPYYDPLSVLQLGAGQTENVMYSYNDVFCSNIVASASNLNGLTLDQQPQPITLLECATCTCQQGAKSGFWDNVICDECKFGFFGESCSGMCPAVCGSVSIGSTELFYEAYQRRIGSTLPCDEPVNDNSAFYYSCPSVDNLRDILNTQAVTWDDSYQRSVYCNDGRNSPGSCLSCNSPLIGSLDIRLDEPRESCYRLTCPSNMDFFQRVNRLEDTFSINLNLAIYYSNVEFQLYGKDFGQAYDTTGNTGLTPHKPIDPYEPCPTGSFVSEYHYCCTDSTKITNYEALNLRGYFVEKHDAQDLSIQDCAVQALSSATYTIGGSSVQLGPYRETSKGLFAHDGQQCHIFRGFESLNLLYVYDLTLAQRSLFIKRVGAGFTADTRYTIYRAYETCPSATSRVFQVWDGTLVSSVTTNTISTSYELGCEFNNIYPTYFPEASDDIIDGALVGSSKDPYTTGGEAILDVIDVIERDQCLSLFYEKCAHGHNVNIQNPFLSYYAYMKVHEYLELQFPDGADQSGKCNIDMFKGKIWCPQCPRCQYKGSVPGVDFELIEGTTCLAGSFPYCKSSTSCTSDHWKQGDTCEYAVPNRTYYLYDATRQTVTFLGYTSTLMGTYTTDECADVTYTANTYQGVFIIDNCGELRCPCYKINTVDDNTVVGNPSRYMYQLNYSTNNGINVFEKYISTFTNGSDYNGSTLMGWYVERMRQAVPDKYRYFKIPTVSDIVEHYEQWLECTCIEDPNDVDHCDTFDVRNCVKFNPLQFEWEPVWYTRGSTAIPYTAPEKEVSASDIHDEDGQGAVLRTSAKLRSNVEIMENTVPDSCTEPRLDSYEVIPSLKIYNAHDVECGKDTVCSCDDEPFAPTYYEVTSGEPASLYVEVTDGLRDSSMTEADCREYGGSTFQNVLSDTGLPSGCYGAGNPPNYYFNTEQNGDSCTTAQPCIQKSPTAAAYVSESECEAYANSIGLAFTAHDDAAITGIDWYDNGGCYCTSHYGKVDPGAGAARYTREWSTANGVASTEACTDLCYNLQEAKAVQGCSRLPVSTVRSDTSMNDVIVYIRNSYYDPPIQCNANNFAGVCIQKLAMSSGTINYEPERIYDSTGNQLHHTECMELIGVANTYSLNTCYEEALKRFNYYNDAYFGSKGLFAVERPQITNPQLYSSDEYLEYNFTTSSELTCYVYKNVDSNVLNSDTFNLLDPDQSLCQYIQNTKKGCARSKDQYRELNSNATVVGATDLYDNKCEDPIFIQSYRSPHVSQTGNVFSKVSPQHSGKLACYDYGPCYSVNASGITNTKFCSCRPSIFTQQFPGLYYPNFQDTPLHNLDASQWGVVGRDFVTSFGYWTSVRDKVSGEGAGGFIETVFNTYEKDILNMCYDDMVVQGNELFKLSNRELKQDQYTGYHLLFAGVQCPAFASLHQPFNTRTRGRFAADVWTADDPLNFYGQTLKGSGHTLLQKIHVTTQGSPYYEQVSGSPDGSMTASECETYAGASWGGSVSISGEIKGCYIITGTGATAGNVYFNTDTTSTALCSLALRACIQRRFHGGDLNYIFGKALFMLDYRQVDMSSITFGDPNYGTPVLGTEIHPIPYESVIKSYCDAGEQPYKRFGPCVNLKGSRVNGKIYMKHFHDSEHYKVKELKTDEYHEMESGAPDGSVSEAECQAYGLSIDKWGNSYDWTDPSGCVKLNDGRLYYNTRSTSNSCSSTVICIQKLEVSVEGDVLLEHDTVILIIKDNKYFAVNNFIPQLTTVIEKDRFQMYTNTYNARAAIREPMFTKHSFYDSHTCAPHGATVNPRINAPVQEVTDAFLFMRPQNEAIVKQGTCQPQQSDDSTDSWGNMAVCEDLAAAQLNGVSYAPSCSCPIGFANMRYIDYNQPWSLHGGCSSIEGDYTGGFIDYKPCNGIGTCSVYLDTPQCCGYDTVTCDARYKGRCVDATGEPKLDTLDNQFCNRPFAGCSKKQRNGLAIDEPNIECGGPTAVEDTFNGMTEEWVKIADYVEGSRTINDATDATQGVVYVDGKPRDAMRSNYAILTSGCYACTDGRYNAEEGKVECRGCFEGKYSVNTKNPWTIPPTQDRYLKSDRGEKVYEYEWWKINGYPTEGATWHEVNEWLVKKPLEPYQLNSDGIWEYNPTIPMHPVIAHNWVTNEYATSCADCPDNYASIPLAAENNNTGDAALGYPGFPDDSTRVRTNNRNCLVCPPGYDTGVADHLQVGISRSVQEECPYDYPFAFSAKDHAPYYGSYCCKNEAKRINPYMFHTTASDGCDDYVRCTSEFEYATNGFYCVDAVQDIPTHQILVLMRNDRNKDVCMQHITSNALEVESICKFVEVSSGSPNLSVSSTKCSEYATSVGKTFYNNDGNGNTALPKGCQETSTYVRYSPSTTSTADCSTTFMCIQNRKLETASREYLFIYVDAYMTIELKYRNVEGAVKLVINIDPNHPYTKEDTFQDIQLRRIVPNYNILLDKDISCNGIFLEKTFATIFFDRALDHGSYEKIQLGRNVDEGACAILAIDYHKRELEKSTIEAYFTLEAGTCYTYPDEVCANGCIESNLPGKTMRISPYGTNITGSSCFLQSVLDVKEGSAYCRKCPKGKFNSRAGANCLPCSIGKYQDEEGKVSCKICENNKYEFTTGSATCITCPAGSENKENDPIHCNLCKAGTYSDDSSDCKVCPAGKTIANNFASMAGKELQITNLDTTVVTGPMINYDPRYDYTAITGYAELDVYGNYITGFSPFFEGLQHMQLTSHDSINDCIDCKDGFVSSLGDRECLACAVGKYAITDAAGQTTCQFCRNGVVKYRQNTFVSVGNFICNPLERLGEVIDDIGIVTENDFTYAQTTNAAFADYVTVTSEQDAKIYCMKHSTCQGYVQKVMRDGTIEWQVPKANETATAISKTYTQYEDSVPDYYAYEKVAADNLCGNDDTCVGYYEDTALSKTYNILPFTVEEEGIYVGQNFAVEKDAVKHCAASATCEGVSKVETYDPFVAAEEMNNVTMIVDKVLLTVPDQAETYEVGTFEANDLSCRAYSLQHNYLFWDLIFNTTLNLNLCYVGNTLQ